MSKKRESKDYRLNQEAEAASKAYDARQASQDPPPQPTFVERARTVQHELRSGVSVYNEGATMIAAAVITAAEAICERLDRVCQSNDLVAESLREVRSVFRD